MKWKKITNYDFSKENIYLSICIAIFLQIAHNYNYDLRENISWCVIKYQLILDFFFLLILHCANGEIRDQSIIRKLKTYLFLCTKKFLFHCISSFLKYDDELFFLRSISINTLVKI